MSTKAVATLGVGLMALIFFSSRNGFDESLDVQSDDGSKKGGSATPLD